MVRYTALATLILFAAARPPLEPLRAVGAIPLPHVHGRIDHLAYEASGHRLFVAALGNDTVEVVDVASGSWVKSLTGFHEPQGIAVVPERDLVAVANGAAEGLQLLDGLHLSMGRSVKLGDDADNVRYDGEARRIYAGYGGGGLAAVDPADGRVIGRAPLPGHPESFQLESAGPRIYINVPDARQIVVVDRRTLKVIATWPVTAAAANFPMALDEAGHRLFVGCRRPATLVVYDTRTGNSTGSVDIAGDTDDLFFDQARQRVYVIAGEGFIDVLDVRGATPSRVARIATARGARTGLYLPDASRLYLAVPERGSQHAEIRVMAAE